MAKKKVKKKSKKSVGVKVVNKKFDSVVRYLITSVILLIVSLLIYSVSENEFASEVFYMLSILLGVVSVAFLIAFLVFVFLKWTKK